MGLAFSVSLPSTASTKKSPATKQEIFVWEKCLAEAMGR